MLLILLLSSCGNDNIDFSTEATNIDFLTIEEDLCGNEIIDFFEECDEGENNSNSKSCTLDCKRAVCGDGLINEENYENCDDQNLIDTDDCSNDCQSYRFVFITSFAMNGNLLYGDFTPDWHCNYAAFTSGLEPIQSKNFKAWIASSNNNSPYNNIKDDTFKGWYKQLSGDLFSRGWDNIINQEIYPLIVDETGSSQNINKLVWTNVESKGNQNSINFHCDNWSSSSNLILGNVGNSGSISKEWTDFNKISCNMSAHLYCFEVN